MSKRIGRRGFIRGMAALGAAGVTGINLFSTGCGTAAPVDTATGGLPGRGEFLIRDAYVMTMDPELGDIAAGHVHVRDGEIVAVGKDIQVGGVTVLNGSGMIVLPGMVDTHWHMWNTLLRSFGGEQAADGYFPRVSAYGQAMTPDDMYQGTRLAAAEAVHSGITTIHDYCHNVQSREHAEGGIRALRESGLRGRWSYGWAQGYPDSKLIDLPTLQAIHADWAELSGEGLLSMGLGWRGMFRPSGPLPPEIYRREFDAARELQIPLSVHVGSADSATGQVAALGRQKLLGPDVQLVHALSATAAELKMVADAGSVVSLSPKTEMRIGYGLPRLGDVLNAGITTGISVDNMVLGGSVNFFDLLETARNLEKGRNHDEFRIAARRMLELGTIEGARSLGIDNVTGSLKPGKRADLILISTRSVNMAVFTDPAQLVVEAAQPANVDTVVVDGRILKRGGALTAVSEQEIVSSAHSALDSLRQRVGAS
jgi:5-methylthioadenosine/S-adenosylhomocysteine deaminase